MGFQPKFKGLSGKFLYRPKQHILVLRDKHVALSQTMSMVSIGIVCIYYVAIVSIMCVLYLFLTHHISMIPENLKETGRDAYKAKFMSNSNTVAALLLFIRICMRYRCVHCNLNIWYSG